MKNYDVYKHPVRGSEAVKEGFSWPAFFFGLLWMLSKGLWGYAGVWFVAFLVCTSIEKAVDHLAPGGSSAIIYLLLAASYLALWLVPAFRGNGWRANKLIRRGFTSVGAVAAQTPDAALAQSTNAA